MYYYMLKSEHIHSHTRWCFIRIQSTDTGRQTNYYWWLMCGRIRSPIIIIIIIFIITIQTTNCKYFACNGN